MRGTTTVILRPGELAKRRGRAGYTQARLARRIGRSHGLIAFYETGDRQPSIESLGLLAEALGCEPGDLAEIGAEVEA